MKRMITGLSHVAVRSGDIQKSVQWYCGVLGLREAFRMSAEDGSLATVYLFIAPSEYLEIFSGGVRKAATGPDGIGLCHICLKTDDIQAAYQTVGERGGPLDSPVKVGGSRCLLFWTHDPDGNAVEIMEMPPESLHAQADRRLSDPSEQE